MCLESCRHYGRKPTPKAATPAPPCQGAGSFWKRLLLVQHWGWESTLHRAAAESGIIIISRVGSNSARAAGADHSPR